MFVADENQRGSLLSVDNLLVLQHLLANPEIDTSTAARICYRLEVQARDILTEMEQRMSYLERGGTGRGTYWTLRPDIYRRLAGPGLPERDRRIDWEAAKTRILSILKQRSGRDEPGLSSKEIRQDLPILTETRHIGCLESLETKIQTSKPWDMERELAIIGRKAIDCCIAWAQLSAQLLT